MARTILYHVTFAPNCTKRLMHGAYRENPVATVHAVEDSTSFTAYHLDNGKHLVPDYAAIRAAIPHQHRKAFDRAGRWWFPLTLRSALSGVLDRLNAASLTLTDSKGRVLGTLYATPYLAER
ncbi:hypothetical protein LO749_20765 [Paracoccus denitrificans]|uniref:hypothetical protein n=1 Tax=Paracoccus denitrificans TaxID=266 RepID=UPI001E629BC7|nr:hypothetical protein [Paracoccus denitrificans]UFS66929.1 hypothetical protein LO749_20765 [Paracoccus denitrificans]